MVIERTTGFPLRGSRVISLISVQIGGNTSSCFILFSVFVSRLLEVGGRRRSDRVDFPRLRSGR